MRTVNLYTLTRLVDDNLKSIYEHSLSQRDEALKIREEELELIGRIVDTFMDMKVPRHNLDDWTYSFSIPHIGKEFDLLKIGDQAVVNVELKSQEVPFAKVKKQLILNRYYLSHITDNIYSFTFMRGEDGIVRLYKYENDDVHETSFEELINCLGKIGSPVRQDIEKLFNPKDYMISPLNNPDKFIAGKYYLNNQQYAVKKKIVKYISDRPGLWGLKGSAGTGKTLLLYDIARTMAVSQKVCEIHCGRLTEGHLYLNEHMDNLTFMNADMLSQESIKEYDILCVDETQRLDEEGLEIILNAYRSGQIKACVFAYDMAQALTKTEVFRNIPEILAGIEGFQEEKLTEKIRANREIYSFIRYMMDLDDGPSIHVTYENVDILPANSLDELDMIMQEYKDKDYTFIAFSPNHISTSIVDEKHGVLTSNEVIGHEYDSVLSVLDDHFKYNMMGELEGDDEGDEELLLSRLLYQNVTRAREKLCFVVFKNPSLFEKLLCIKEGCLDW